jgi:peroxiredoxin
LVRVQDAWRLVGAPPTADGTVDAENSGLFFDGPGRRGDIAGAGRPSDKTQALLKRLEELDKKQPATPAEMEQANVERADILEDLIKDADAGGNAEMRGDWTKQLADSISASTQAGVFPGGVARLKALYDRTIADPANGELAAFIRYRFLTAEYGEKMRDTKADYAAVQAQWLKDLEAFLDANPTTADGPEAMLQLANGLEIAGDEQKAIRWYDQLTSTAPESPAGKKGKGAKARLQSLGKEIRISGKSPTGTKVDLEKYRGKIVLVHYWSSEYSACTNDLPLLSALEAKYGKRGFTILGISLDSSPQPLMAYLKANPLHWEQIYEPGGLDSRLANELGILTLPTMLLVDRQGKVINRGTHAAELDGELKNLLKPAEK